MPFINVSDVVVKNRLRDIDSNKVDSLVESIKEIGLMSPIVVHGNRLICGNHRLEAYRRLGINQIFCTNISDTTKEDENILLEIDENLIRSELTPRQREQHIEIKAKILAKRYKKKYLEKAIKAKAKEKEQNEENLRAKVMEADSFRGDLGEVDLNVTGNTKSVIRVAESNAMAQAAKEIANSLGHKSVAQVNKDIANSEALTNANLDENKLDQLNATQLKAVAKVAKKEPEQAKKELDKQIAINEAKANGTLNKSASIHTGDEYKRIENDINVLCSSRSIARRNKDNPRLSKYDRKIFEELEMTLNEAIESLKKFRTKLKEA